MKRNYQAFLYILLHRKNIYYLISNIFYNNNILSNSNGSSTSSQFSRTMLNVTPNLGTFNLKNPMIF